MKNRTWVFRPIEYNYRLKAVYCGYHPRGPHFQLRSTNKGHFEKFNVRVFQIIHHYSAHAPKAVRQGWKKAYKRQDIRFGKTGSRRFLNKYTAHSYL